MGCGGSANVACMPSSLPVGAKNATDAPALHAAWFAARGWQPFDFQREVWALMSAGASGLLHEIGRAHV